MATARGSLMDMASERLDLRTIPSLLTLLFAWVSLAQFGGTTMPELTWIGYQMKPVHGVAVSAAAYVVAFMSSETDDWRRYARGEQALIGASMLVIVGEHFVPIIGDTIANAGAAGGFVAWLIAVIGWGVAIR